MPRNILVRCCSLAAVALFVLIPSAAVANDGTGGMAAVERPEVEQLSCASSGGGTCAPGEVLEVKGGGLDSADAVIFRGGRSRFDDRRAKPQVRKFHSLTVKVPTGAKSGPVLVATKRSGRSAPTPPVQVLSAVKPATALAAPVAAGAGVFPIRGAHDYGTEVNRFGGGRGHKGHDVFATCGTPVVAALAGTVTIAKFQDRAGNYAVITADDGTSQAYMHMRQPAIVNKGDRVEAGQQVGEIGETGRASGCHLHFELWTAPGWYEGGEPIDPLPFLRKLDSSA